MREIKFRAWDKKGQEWWDNYPTGNALVLTHDKSTGIVFQQYTGLKDKNGVEIYEGDILAGEDGEWTDNDTTFTQYLAGIVTWWGDNARWYLSDDLEGYMGDDDKADEPMDWVKYEVVGNIHENPNLLEATEVSK